MILLDTSVCTCKYECVSGKSQNDVLWCPSKWQKQNSTTHSIPSALSSSESAIRLASSFFWVMRQAGVGYAPSRSAKKKIVTRSVLKLQVQCSVVLLLLLLLSGSSHWQNVSVCVCVFMLARLTSYVLRTWAVNKDARSKVLCCTTTHLVCVWGL